MSYINNAEVENTPLYYEVLEVLTKCDKNTQAYWTVMFILNDAGDLYDPFQLTQFTIERDYAGGYCDYMGITALIPYGKYNERIYKNRNTLKAVLTRHPLVENSTLLDTSKPTASEEFIAILKEPSSTMSQLQGSEAKGEFAMDLKGFMEVQFQLFNKADERIRITTIGGIYRYTKVDELIKYVITSNVEKYKIPEPQKIKGVDMVPCDNHKKQEQVVIPHGLPIYDLPGFMQKTYGVYNAGLGSYIQGKYWYIFSLFDVSRYFDSKITFNLYILPKKKFSEIERTYRVLGNDISVIVTSNTDYRADTNRAQTLKGDGVRFTNGDTVMDGFAKTKGNKSMIKRKENNFEFKTKDNRTVLDYAPIHDTRITSNPFVPYSELNMRNGGLLTLLWENSRPNIIQPGMTCRIVYFDKETVKEAHGVVLGLNHVVQKVGDFNTRKHTGNSRLQIFTNLKLGS